MYKGDSLIVDVDEIIVGITDGIETSRFRSRYSFSMEVQKSSIVRYIRFTMYAGKCSIEPLEELPSNIYIPTGRMTTANYISKEKL